MTTLAESISTNPDEANGIAGNGNVVPRVGRSGMGYVWDMPEYGVSLRLDYLTPRGRELSGEFEIYYSGKFLLQGIHSLNSTESRDRLTQALSKRTNGVVPWDRLISVFCAAVLRKEREGESTQYTHDAPIQPTNYLIDRLVQEHKANLLYGPGGGGKGYLAIATCVAVASKHGFGPLTVKPAVPFYFDWEDDFETFNARVKRICAGLNIPVPRIGYRRMRGMAADKINEIARAMADEHATYGVIDSVSACAGSPGKGETWDHIAHRMFDALDRVVDPNDQPMTWLLIGHVTGESAGKTNDVAGKMFGSIQNMNRARCAWEMRSSQEDGSDTVAATLYHGKWNHTGRKAPIGLSFTFDDDIVRIDSGNVTQIRPNLTEKLADHLASHGKASVRALSLVMRTTEATVRVALNRGKDRFSYDDNGFWSIAAKEMPEPSEPDELPWA